MEQQAEIKQLNQLLQDFLSYFHVLKTDSKDSHISGLASDSCNLITKDIGRLKKAGQDSAAILAVLQRLNGDITKGIQDWGPWPEEVNKKINEYAAGIVKYQKYFSGIVF